MDVDLEKEEKPSSGDRSSQEYGQVISRKQGSFWVRIIDGFRQNPNARVSEQLVDADGKPLPDQPKAQPALAMKLKQRHLQMIAIGGSIGKFESVLGALRIMA